MRLCELPAAEAFIDTTYLHFSGFADNVRGQWDAESVPDVRRRGGEAAADRRAARRGGPGRGRGGRRAAGCKAGTPVVAGCGDTAASFLACGATREGVCVDVAGTASVFAATTRAVPRRRRARHARLGPFGHAGTLASVCLHQRRRDERRVVRGARWPRAKTGVAARRSTGSTGWPRRIVPAADDPLFLPHLGGRVTPSQPCLRGVLGRPDLVAHGRAPVPGRAGRRGPGILPLPRRARRRLNPELAIREVRVTGGGQQSALWNQIKADALGRRRSCRSTRREGAPLGAALAGRLRRGPVRRSGRRRAALDRARTTPCAPDPTLAGHYRARLDRYRRLLDLMQQWSETGTGRPSDDGPRSSDRP